MSTINKTQVSTSASYTGALSLSAGTNSAAIFTADAAPKVVLLSGMIALDQSPPSTPLEFNFTPTLNTFTAGGAFMIQFTHALINTNAQRNVALKHFYHNTVRGSIAQSIFNAAVPYNQVLNIQPNNVYVSYNPATDQASILFNNFKVPNGFIFQVRNASAGTAALEYNLVVETIAQS